MVEYEDWAAKGLTGTESEAGIFFGDECIRFENL